MARTVKQLIIENEELRSRLSESEEIIHAIRNGEMDAIVVTGTRGDQVYSISSAEAPYRTFIEEMNEGALTLSKDGIIIYCNHRFAELVQKPVERVIGSYLKHYISPKYKADFDLLLAQKHQNKKDVLIISLINSNYVKLSFHLLPAYINGDNFILIATDISELKKKEIELNELHSLLEQRLYVIERLRMQLIDKKVDDKLEIDRLRNTNKKLVKEVSKHKPGRQGLKAKQQKAAG